MSLVAKTPWKASEPPRAANPQEFQRPRPHSQNFNRADTIPLACSRLSDIGEDATSSRFTFVFALSQVSGPNYLGALNRLQYRQLRRLHTEDARSEGEA